MRALLAARLLRLALLTIFALLALSSESAPEALANPTGFRFTLVVDESVTGNPGYKAHVRTVFESRQPKQPIELTAGDEIRFYQVEMNGTAQGWNGPEKKAFAIGAPEPRHKDFVAARLKVEASGATLSFSMPFVPGGDGITYWCGDHTPNPEFKLSTDELKHWAKVSKTLSGTLSEGGDASCGGRFSVSFRGGTAEEEDKDPVSIQGPGCSCDPDEILEVKASAKSSSGTFAAFEVKSEAKAAEVVLNRGGKDPLLRLRGDGKTTGATTVVAIYKDKGKTVRSKPHLVHFGNVNEIVEVESASHLADHEYLFSGQGKVLSIPVRSEAWLDGTSASERIVWSITERGSPVVQPDKKQGASVKFEAKQMPDQNDTFGPREISARVDAEGCSCTKKHSVKLFFARNERNNPLGQEPNWSYYWKQTKAGQGFAYKVVPVIPQPKLSKPSPDSVARYDPIDDVVYLRDALLSVGCAGRPSGERDKGIDCYASTLRHETQHKIELTSWWGPKLQDYSDARDPDWDYVPNEIEDLWGCDWLSDQSCPDLPPGLAKLGAKDLETNAYKVGWQWPLHSASSVDWACPGQQTKACGAE